MSIPRGFNNTQILADLHTHSDQSDGTLSPEELVRAAAKSNVQYLALTDHDTIRGLDRAVLAAKENGITLIPGIELEIAFAPGEFHLLGLGLKEWDGELSNRLENLVRCRNERNEKILDKIRAAGIHMEHQELLTISGGHIIARPHFARLLYEKGAAKSIEHAMKDFLAQGMPFHEEKEVFSLQEGIKLIHNAGGKAILAHPKTLRLSWGKMAEYLGELKEAGLDGIEAYHSSFKKRECERFMELADKFDFLVSAGSDYHGDNRKGRKLGYTAAKQKIEKRFAEPFING